MSSSTKASARLAPWFRTAERTQTAQKKRTRACHPRCTLRHLRHTRGQLKHRTRTSTIKPRGMILFFTVIYNTHDHRNTDRPVLSSPGRARFAPSRGSSSGRPSLRRARRSIVERLERRTRIQTRARESSFGNRIAPHREREDASESSINRSSTEREDASESSINRSRSIVDRTRGRVRIFD